MKSSVKTVPSELYVSWCATCGKFICADESREAVARSTGCECTADEADIYTIAALVAGTPERVERKTRRGRRG
jgi:hypothetical protein